MGDRRILIWDNHGSVVRLRFSRYGFEETTVQLPHGPRTIQNNTMVITRLADTMAAPNVVSGTITLADAADDPVAVSVLLADYFGPNRGFRRTTETDGSGTFTITEIPNGEFEIFFSKRGYVSYSLALDLQDGNTTCRIDAQRHYEAPGLSPCNLHDIDLQLHPIRTVAIKWLLQDDPGSDRFPNADASDVALTSGAPDDWRRGGWTCCGSSFKFGTAEIDKNPDRPDLVVFTDTDGTIFFGQPAQRFIAAVDEPFEVLDEVPESLHFATQLPAENDQTYILKTYPSPGSDVSFFVKIKVTGIR